MKKTLFALLACGIVSTQLWAENDAAVSLEVGIGYLNTTFTGKQSGYRNFKGKGSAKGLDMYVGANIYATERFGLQLGMGAEFLNGDWNEGCGVGEYNYNYTMQVLKLTLAITQDTSNNRHKEEKALIDKYAGTNYDKPFDKTQSYKPNQPGSQGYLYKSPETGEKVLKRDKYDIKYTNVGANKGDYKEDATSVSGYKYVGSGNGTHTREIQYVFEKKTEVDGKKQGAYAQNAENKGAIKGTDGNSYDYVGEGKGDYSVTQEEYYLYHYNGSIYDSRGLTCSAPSLGVKAWYFFVGAFYDVLQFEHFGLRAFGNVGLGYDMMKDKFSRKTYYADGGDYQGFATVNANETPSQEQGSVYLPITAGLRFIIAQNHGIEFYGKYNLVKSKWKGTQSLYDGAFNGKDMPVPVSVDTKITRDYSWGIRYVYEFKKDE